MGSNPGVRFGIRFLGALAAATILAVIVVAIAAVPGVVPGAMGTVLAFGSLLMLQLGYSRVRRTRVLARRRIL